MSLETGKWQEDPMPETGLVPAARRSDVEDIYRTHVGALYAYVYRRVGNRETAEDITSDVFVKTLMHLDPTREGHSIIAWLYRVARNAIADHWRRGMGVATVALDETQVIQPEQADVDETGQEDAQARATALLQQLPENYRAVLNYRIMQRMSLAETAQRMGTTVGNVKVLQHRAIKRAADLRRIDSGSGNGQPHDAAASSSSAICLARP
jgi:RNA polymerase sigma-70 factor (ECF subfamily)